MILRPIRPFSTLLLSILIATTAPAQRVTIPAAPQVKVVAASPRGITAGSDQSHTVFVTFDRPMVPLAAPLPPGAPVPMRIEPMVAGKFRWVGTTTLAFIPAGRLPFSTSFTATVLPGTASFSGARIAGGFSWSFETPRPQVVESVPREGQKFVELDHAILLRFNQPVDPATVARSMSIEVRRKGVLSYPGFSSSRPSGQALRRDSTHAVLLTVRQPFGLDATVSVLCQRGLVGVEGPLGMAEPYRLTFCTFGELSFLRVESTNDFRPEAALKFHFTNPVPMSELARHLRFEPEVRIPSDAQEEEWYKSNELYLSLPLAAETNYRGKILAGLKDQFGNLLPADAEFSFRTTSFRPYVRMVTGPGVLEATENHRIPVSFMNTDSVLVQLGRVNPARVVELMRSLEQSYFEELALKEGILLAPDEKSGDPAAFSRSVPWRVRTPRNTRVMKPLDLDPVLRPSSTGIVFAQVDNLNMENRRYLKTLVQVTEMGITAKFSTEEILIWVTRLKDASPVPGASVEIRSEGNAVLWKGTTNARGLAIAPGREGGMRHWVIVTKGKDVAFTNSRWENGIEPWVFGIEREWRPQGERTEAVLFTDRGLYRAGETVDIKGIVRIRSKGEWNVKRNLPLRLTIMNSRDEEVLSMKPVMSEFGSFTLRCPLKSTAPLGGYFIRLEQKIGGGGRETWDQIGWGDFRVEAFRPAEFEVTGQAERKEVVVGDTTVSFLTARYLFGAPLKNEAVRIRISAQPSSWYPEGYDGYFFGPLEWLNRFGSGSGYRLLASWEGKLDGSGSTVVRTPLRVGEIRGTSTILVEGEVTSPTRQVIAGRTSVLAHGGEFGIGLKPGTTFLATDSTLVVEVVAVTPAGIRQKGVPVTIRLVQRVWNSVRKAESGGRYAWVSEEADSVRDSVRVTTGAESVTARFRPTRAGFYYIEGVSADPRGNQLVTHAYLYVSGSDYVAWARTNDDKIELVADRSNYVPGDVAQILVKSPYETAPALISVEREGILTHYTTTLTGSAPRISIPVTPRMLPNVFVSVVLLHGRSARPGSSPEGDVGKPSFKVGYLKLPVSPKERELRVSLALPRGDFRPGDTVSLSLRVTDATGRGVLSEATLSVADLGVLNLINYRLPNPFGHFYRHRPLGVTTTETRMHIVEQREYGEKGEDEGGGGAEVAANVMDAEGLRMDFRPSAYWNPGILTDTSGAAAVTFKLPDNLTAFEGMAVAQTVDGKFGYGERSFTVSKKLLCQPSMPRFARVGDLFTGGVVIINHTETERSVSLTAAARGIRMTGKETSVHQLKAGEAKEVLFSFQAEKTGTASVIFRVTSGEEKDGLLWKIPLQERRLRESVALYSTLTEEKKGEQVAIPDSIDREVGEVEVTAASTAMVGLSGGLSYLFTYPYACLEQRCSAVLPMILARDLVEAFKFSVLREGDYRQVVLKTLDELPQFQRENGGFSYWKNTPRTWPYVSAYAVYTLIQGKKHGYHIDERSLMRGIEYLRRVLSGEEKNTEYSDLASGGTRALILYDLALAGVPDHGQMRRLFSERQALPLFGRAYLLRALRAAGVSEAMQEDLARELENQAKIAPTSAHFEEPREEGLSWIYHSTERTTALTMQALIETRPESPLIPKVVRWLLDRQKGGRWRTTQENLFVVDALATYFSAYEKEEPNFRATLRMAGRTLLDELFSGRTMKTAAGRIPIGELPPAKESQIDITKAGPGRLYYGIRMNYTPMAEQPAKDEGISVTRTLEIGEEIQEGGKVYEAGTIVKVTLGVMTTQERNFVVVEDPIPAGFEMINSSFATTAYRPEEEQNQSAPVFEHAERYDDRALIFADHLPAGYHTFTYLVRVVRPGSYAHPATRAEGMYEPEVFGQTESGRVRVK